MTIFWFQIGFGLVIIFVLVMLWVKFSKEDTANDEKILKIIRKELEQDGYYNFELESIISLYKPNITTVVVNVGYQEIALEIDRESGEIISKERIARQ